jgi:hypothetical protein
MNTHGGAGETSLIVTAMNDQLLGGAGTNG